ncbi:MAG: hypothetical protein LC802_18310 [Acidobacteria bacterium]|nr:hypothetical protein [Acidobacteriota bacterium]
MKRTIGSDSEDGTMNSHVPCSACGSHDGKKLMYTSQGGILWTPFLNFIKCRSCGVRFHGKTGQLDPQVPKVMRIVTVLIIMSAVGLLFGFVMSLSSLRQKEASSPVAVPASPLPTPARK